MKYLITCLLFILLSLIAIYFFGCNSQLQSSHNEPNNPGQVIYKTISSTDWLLSLFLMGATASIFCAFNGMKSGWAGLIACIGGIVLKIAFSSVYVYWATGLIVVGSLLLAVVSIIWKNKAIKELIIGAQDLKQSVPDGNATLAAAQSKPTVKLINQVKASLKTKGII